jgi:hypothetical protein
VKNLTIAAVLVAAVIAAASTGQRARAQELTQPYPLVTVREAWQAVTSELRSRGFPEAQMPRVEDIELPVAVPARAKRDLHVSAVCWDADAGRARFRMQCTETGACLPFLAYLRGAGHVDAPSCRIESHSASVPKAVPAVHSGEHATAVWMTPTLRLTADVTCLERGARGEIVRVRGEEGRIFRARVTGPALVEALPE